MLFTSYPFLFLFLPITLVVFLALGRHHHKWAAAWLFVASLFFYGWWNPKFVSLLLASILFNFFVGKWIYTQKVKGNESGKKALLTFGVAANLILLGYYKYTNFFLSNVDVALGTDLNVAQIALPLGISFFTFTQIAFLVDASRQKAREFNLVHYGLFVTYFPHLLAGPILHHSEMMPQFANKDAYRFNIDDISVGLTIFVIGLAKKVVFADSLIPLITPVYGGGTAAHLPSPDLMSAWVSTLAYTLQLYFDFSGYSDMAIGLSRLFGIKLPLNFESPYRSVNITEFWRRWHMTLSRFLRDYLYIPLGGNRKGEAHRSLNLFLTMLLGGFWHGASWNFLIWGALHGFYLIIHRAWVSIKEAMGIRLPRALAPIGKALGIVATFLTVMVGWVFFRAHDIESATTILSGMAGLNDVSFARFAQDWDKLNALYDHYWMIDVKTNGTLSLFAFANDFVVGVPLGILGDTAWLGILLSVAWFAPNTQQILARLEAALNERNGFAIRWWKWKPSAFDGAVFGFALFVVVMRLSSLSITEFLYFNF